MGWKESSANRRRLLTRSVGRSDGRTAGRSVSGGEKESSLPGLLLLDQNLTKPSSCRWVEKGNFSLHSPSPFCLSTPTYIAASASSASAPSARSRRFPKQRSRRSSAPWESDC